MTMRPKLVALFAFAGALLVAPAAPPRAAEAPDAFALKFEIETDRQHYELDGTILILARFTYLNNMRTKFQFYEAGCGSAYFHLVLEPVGHKANVSCERIFNFQYATVDQLKETLRDTTWKRWLKEVGVTLPHQLIVYLPRERGLPVGKYKLRVGYTVGDQAGLAKLIDTATGVKLDIDEGAKPLEGGWDGALLSEPITITIGPDQEKKK